MAADSAAAAVRRRRQPHADDGPPGPEGRAQALQRADRPRPEPAAGERHSRRHHHRPAPRAATSRRTACSAAATRASRSRFSATICRPRSARRIDVEERHGQGSGDSQRPRRPRRRPSGARRAGRPPEGGVVRPVGDRRGEHHPHQRRRHAGRAVPRSAATSIRSSCGCARRIASASKTSTTCSISTPSGQVLQAKNLMTVKNQAGPTEIAAQEPGAR